MSGPELGWREVAERLAGARHYWVHTTRPDGAPHVAPLWGVVVASRLYVYTRSDTVKASNLAADPRAAVHLESAAEVVIVHGRLEHLGRPLAHPEVVAAFADKYDDPDEVPFLPSSDLAFDVLYGLDPLRALAWSLPDTDASTRRWRAP